MINEDLMKKLKNVKINLNALKEISSSDKKATQEANERLDLLEKISGTKMSAEYRNGFIQGYIEAFWANNTNKGN